ncbi:MAG: pentapeptide repeat-containing protein [Ardenticatenales bacterium]|nr:pentapeptide repeat-containing protein [Ardenticatenales bacterium]
MMQVLFRALELPGAGAHWIWRRRKLSALTAATVLFVYRVIDTHSADWTSIAVYGKSVWDWLGLLIIPVMLAIGAWLLSERRTATDRELASRREQDEVFRVYLDRLESLLLDNELRNSQLDSEVRHVARARTLTVLRQLAGDRKREVVQFLSESGLIQSTDDTSPVISLRGSSLVLADPSTTKLHGVEFDTADISFADLRGADLRAATLRRTDLTGVDFTAPKSQWVGMANSWLGTLVVRIIEWTSNIDSRLGKMGLDGADLSDADLTGANLGHADLRGANLQRAKLCEAALLVADLKGANLAGANLAAAVLWQSDVRNADLRNANLTDANGTGANVEELT